MEAQLAGVAAPQPPPADPTIWRVDDALWADLQPLLVVDKPRKKPGRKRNDDRPILAGLIWLARTGAQWAAWPRAVRAEVHRP
jgi:transposase